MVLRLFNIHRLTRTYRLGLLVALGCSLLPVFFVTWSLPQTPVFKHLQNFLHLPAFASAFLLLRRGLHNRHSSRTDLLAALVLLAAGGVIELVQPYFGRSRSFEDLLLNAGGILCGFTLWRVFVHQQQKGWLLVCVIIIAAALSRPLYWHLAEEQRTRAFPLLLDFDTGALTAFVGVVSKAELAVESAPAAWLQNQTQVARLSVEPAGWPGFYLQPPVNDWSDLHYIELDVYSPGTQPVKFAVRVDDIASRGGGDNFDRPYLLSHGLNALRIPLDEIRTAPADREMDLRKIRQIFLYVHRPENPVTLYVDNLRLTD